MAMTSILFIWSITYLQGLAISIIPVFLAASFEKAPQILTAPSDGRTQVEADPITAICTMIR
jgi:hypothetical protein